MTRWFASTGTALMLILSPFAAWAHCDAVDGPVATAATKALDAKNVNLVLPYVAAEAEAELIAAFEQAVIVRGKDAAAKNLADRYFMETAVRLHRAGEKAPYTGLKPAGTDFGPAIPAAEKTLETGKREGVISLISEEVAHGLAERFRRVAATQGATKTPSTRAEVAAARQRVSAELEFIGYVEALYRATQGSGHAE
jgi:hypothetical protein